MKWHFIEGEAGCAYAVEHGCVAVVVDALRASATATMLLEAGATEIIVTAEVEEARAAKEAYPDALLFGERGGLPPEDFDYGNSPREVEAAQGRRIIFTTTSGARRLVDAWGAAAVYMGCPLNAVALVQCVLAHDCDVVVIPAGKVDAPEMEAQEDLAAAALLAMMADAEVEEGALLYRHWRARIENEGLTNLFETATHAEDLRRLGLGEDVAYCSRINVTQVAPRAVERNEFGVTLRRAE